MDRLTTYTTDGAVTTVTMDDGKANALSPAMLEALSADLDRAELDGLPVVLTGRPDRFSGGFDLSLMRDLSPAMASMLRTGFELSARLLAFPAPVVAACNGHALAMGAFLLLSVDYRVGTAGPYKVGANEVAVGLTMPAYGIEICRQRLSPAHFHRSVINAEIFTPEQAVEAGYLDELVPANSLAETARDRAAALGALPRAVHHATKLRARALSLEAISAAIAADDAAFRAVLGG